MISFFACHAWPRICGDILLSVMLPLHPPSSRMRPRSATSDLKHIPMIVSEAVEGEGALASHYNCMTKAQFRRVVTAIFQLFYCSTSLVQIGTHTLIRQ